MGLSKVEFFVGAEPTVSHGVEFGFTNEDELPIEGQREGQF